MPPAVFLFHTALPAGLIFFFGIIYFRMAYSKQVDGPLLVIAGIGKSGVFFITLYCYLNGIVPITAFILAAGDLLFGMILLSLVLFERSRA